MTHNNRDNRDPNLPLGYRWATDKEVETGKISGRLELGQRQVPLVYGPNGGPLRREDQGKQRRLAVLKDGNLASVKQFLVALDAKPGPRVGDYVEFADGVVRRFTHLHVEDDLVTPRSLQTTDERFGGPSFHLGEGYLSYSGSLRPGVRVDTLTRKDEIRLGWAWIWDGGWMKAHNAVDVAIPLRVFTTTLSSAEN